MGVAVYVRTLTAADVGAFVALIGPQLAETAPHLDVKPDILAESIRRSLSQLDPQVFLAEDRRRIVGYLVGRVGEYLFTDGVFTSQEVLYVVPEKRGTRAAALLIKAYAEWGKRLGAKEIIFGVSNGINFDRTARFIELVSGANLVGGYLRIVR